MFQAFVLYFLRRYLGEYVEGLSVEALRISVWKGDVFLKDLRLKAEALNSLNLPVTIKAGFIGTITLQVPWKSLGKDPVIVLIDRVFVLAVPAPDGHTLKDEDREKLFESKLKQIEEAESTTIDAAIRREKAGAAWYGSFVATIIGNLKVTISNVHIRYEDSISNPGHPFCSGITLSKLAAVTTDEHDNETFDTSGALDKLRKVKEEAVPATSSQPTPVPASTRQEKKYILWIGVITAVEKVLEAHTTRYRDPDCPHTEFQFFFM